MNEHTHETPTDKKKKNMKNKEGSRENQKGKEERAIEKRRGLA
jgi:hypothetical protein